MNFRLSSLVLASFILSACGEAGDAVSRSTDAPASAVSVDENIVTSAYDPSLRIKIDPSLTYLGRHDIRIRDVASGERLVFADVQDGSAVRLFMLQFEGFNEGVDEQYRYNLSNSPEVAGYRWRSNAYTFNMADSIANNPGAESDTTAAFLRAQGIGYPENWMMWRSLTVTTDDLRNELILFYVEDLASTGATLDQIYDENGDSTEMWRGMMPALERRANASFALSGLDEDDWQPIPRYFDRVQ